MTWWKRIFVIFFALTLALALSFVRFTGERAPVPASAVQVFVLVRGNKEIEAVSFSWGRLFPRLDFVLSNPSQSEPARSAGASQFFPGHTIVSTRSTDGGIHATLAVKLWQYLRWACTNDRLSKAQWLFRADADSFVIAPRLLRFLATFDAEDPLMLGFIWSDRPNRTQPFLRWPSGGAGVAISREAFRRMCAGPIMNSTEQLPVSCGFDDVMLGVLASRSKGVRIRHCKAQFSWLRPSRTRTRFLQHVCVLHDLNKPSNLLQIGAALDGVMFADRLLAL